MHLIMTINVQLCIFIVMFALDFLDTNVRHHQHRPHQMSYTFGTHTVGKRIFYGGDRRVIEQDVCTVRQEAAPAWVVADCMLSKHRGIPLSPAEELLISQPFQSEGLLWLEKYLAES